ncbi:hypothetical protein Patl1_23527 [Pistacia atlantica]|uniref:Uncharacterized protein n=1 Tax=Pistacia atlantica TaxID=434234 RepID=A0ACC0ZVI5_9ROSI|nr:hypothetical protein Patl1_23527 [Pistacia atlantica]
MKNVMYSVDAPNQNYNLENLVVCALMLSRDASFCPYNQIAAIDILHLIDALLDQVRPMNMTFELHTPGVLALVSSKKGEKSYWTLMFVWVCVRDRFVCVRGFVFMIGLVTLTASRARVRDSIVRSVGGGLWVLLCRVGQASCGDGLE